MVHPFWASMKLALIKTTHREIALIATVCLSKVVKFLVIFLFFFASRRRHTGCLSDWSSDVCSSDLLSCLAMPLAIALGLAADRYQQTQRDGQGHRQARQGHGYPGSPAQGLQVVEMVLGGCSLRSEEGRGGKECRSRWAPDH